MVKKCLVLMVNVFYILFCVEKNISKEIFINKFLHKIHVLEIKATNYFNVVTLGFDESFLI